MSVANWETFIGRCALCPRECGVDRAAGQRGFCGAGRLPKVARAALHQWEEPPISGTRGSGTVFFSDCNLRCRFCQNHPISQEGVGRPVSVERLAAIYLEQQARGAHNLNLVSASHYLPQAAAALELARREGLRLPVVWNSNGYEQPGALALLEGLVDVYLPDLKYSDSALGERLSAAPDYPRHAQAAIREMLRQVGETRFDEAGLVTGGLLVRHLVLPGEAENTRGVLRWLRENLPAGVYVSLMAQYTPAYLTARPDAAREFGPLAGTLSPEEYEAAVDYFLELGLENGFAQELGSVGAAWTPPFDGEGVD